MKDPVRRPKQDLTPFGMVDRLMDNVPPMTPLVVNDYSRDMLFVLIAMNLIAFVDNTARIVFDAPLITYFTFFVVAAQIHGIGHFRRAGAPWISIATAPFLLMSALTLIEMLLFP
ncbi:MAG: hypothetical protein WD044_11395 [Dongiaceae bacterium]